MKLFIAIADAFCDDRKIIGVFSTQVKAFDALYSREKSWGETGDDIEEWELDVVHEEKVK